MRDNKMDLNNYLIENERHIGDVVILFSVGAAVDKVSGDTFPLMADNTIGFDEPHNLMDMDISYDSEEWYNALNGGDKKVVDDVMVNLSYEALVDKEESKCLTPPNISKHIKPPNIGGINNV